jgi:hypothetical protein
MADVSPLTRVKRRRTNDVNVFYTYIVRHMQGVYVVRGLAAGFVGSAGSPFGPTV